MIDPARHTRRSPVYRKLLAAGAAFREFGDGAVAASVPGAKGTLGLADLSPLPRLGYKGRNALSVLTAAGLNVPDTNNTARLLSGGGLVARLADTEALLLGGPAAADTLAAYADIVAEGCYAVPRRDSHAWFLLIGDPAADCLAKLCGVDLRPHRFDDKRVAQTILAATGGIVIRADHGAALAYHILTDGASAPYLWDSLVDAMAEFDGTAIGLDDFKYFATA